MTPELSTLPAPTRWALRLISHILPKRARGEWVEEWTGEIITALSSGVVQGVRGRIGLLRGAVHDAWTARRYAVQLAEARNPEMRGHRGDRGTSYNVDGGGVMDGMWKDFLYAGRALRTRPAHCLVAVLTLGLGVGVTTAMFGVVDSVLLRPLPYDGADSIVVIREVDTRDGAARRGVSAANARDLSTMSRSLSDVAIANAYGYTLLEEGRALSIRGFRVSRGFFAATGGDVALGRLFLPDEFVEGSEQVILLGHDSWVSRFSRDSTIVGRRVVLDGEAHTVVGVLEPDFEYPSSGEIYTPRPPMPWDGEARGAPAMDGVARLASGTSLSEAQAELDRIARELTTTYPEFDSSTGFRITSLEEHLFGRVRSPLLFLMGAGVLVLLVAMANIAGLQLARGIERSREFALRAALGAGRDRIVRLTVLEGLWLGILGAGLSVGLAMVGIDFVRWLVPPNVPRIDGLAVDARFLGFALVTSVLGGCLSALVPARMAVRSDLQLTLQQSSPRSAGGREAGALGDRLVVAEIAVALALAIGAGLLLQSYRLLLVNDLGFEPSNRLAVQVFAYDENDEPDLEFVSLAAERIGALPGVESVGVTTAIPLADNESVWRMAGDAQVRVDGATSQANEALTARLISAGPGYPAAMGIALRIGRGFDRRDGPESVPVALVNEAFARRHLTGGAGPLGRRIGVGAEPREWREVVGVLADVRPEGLASEAVPEVYVPFYQKPTTGGITFVVSTTTDPSAYANDVREAIWEVNPQQAVWAIRPVRDLLSDWSLQRRFNTLVLSVFAALAVALSGIGVYGVMAAAVRRRTNELGVRRALGGQAYDVVGMLLGRSLRLAMTGVGLGLVGALAVSHSLRGMLFGMGPFDPITFCAVSIFLVAIALLATIIPAVRATAVDPLVALRRD